MGCNVSISDFSSIRQEMLARSTASRRLHRFHHSVFALLVFWVVSATNAGAVEPAITNIDEFLNQCPGSDPIYAQLIADFQIRYNGTVVPPPSCTEPVSAMPISDYTDALVALQGLRVAYYLDQQQPGQLPWTPLTFYGWMKSRVRGINFRDGVVGGYCCDYFEGKAFVVTGAADDINREFDRKWEGIAGNIAFYAHETRHADPGAPGHTSCCGIPGGCDDTYDETNLSAYGVQWWLNESWLSGNLNAGYSCLPPARVQSIAQGHLSSTDGLQRRFCANPPRVLSLPASPGGDCPFEGRLVVPIVLSSSGLNGSFFESELVLTNRGSSDAALSYVYTAAMGGRNGTASDTLAAGTQRIVPNVIEYLRGLGIPAGDSGDRAGTLEINFSGGSAAAAVRTTTMVPRGRAGLSYAALPARKLPALFPVSLCGLRQNSFDRSNVAVMNAGVASDGPVTLRLTMLSGDPAQPQVLSLPEITVAPGEFSQLTEVLASNGSTMTNGYVTVTRLRGSAPYYAYAVINDQVNSDGSFVAPVNGTSPALVYGLTVPVIVETSTFSSELVLTNFDNSPHTLHLLYVASALTGGQAAVDISLQPREQRILPAFVQVLRDSGVISDPPGATFSGPLFVTDAKNDLRGVSVAARTSSPGGGGQYGVYYPAIPVGSEAKTTAWLYGLQQNAENRTNVALVNVGSVDASTDSFRIDLFDGVTGRKASTIENVEVPARAFLQVNSILARHAPGVTNGYVRVTRTAGHNPFITYAVINDGGQPGDRSGDGSYIAMTTP